ncbi:MAG: DUF4177 domain-containing protein [Paracoccus sp. (in: a-proteobacteria)]|nr:DUF4177 domain-containing protein [Paracoccus sp. (in: a-proteobacteria)]
MHSYEYAAIPAPLRSEKVKGTKVPSDRYAATLTEAINNMAANGWEYLRAETLPSEERSGLTGRTTVFHNLLIFRREKAIVQELAAGTMPQAHPAPQPEPADAADQPAEAEVNTKTEAGEEPSSPVFSEKMRMAEKPAEPSKDAQ